MSIRENIGKTISSAKDEYGKVDFGDKILDLISLVGAALFLVSLVSVFVSSTFNAMNIVFILYPLAVGGIAAALRMKKREKPEEAGNIFKEWIWIMSSITAISLLIIILALVLA
ncbi:MAG: hypothetical protein GOP50_10075 [Candidatus Heimdallarchaeota archaeon]|nr:hypothetical protein [Candidatus Heimdallarchaeota archaeon]